MAACLLIAILSVLSGSTLAITITLVATMFGLGIASELQSILFADFIGRNMQSESRTRMKYWGMGLGGVGTILLVWPIHVLILEAQPTFRHSTIVSIATACFLVSALLIFSVRKYAALSDGLHESSKRQRWKQELRKRVSNYRLLADTPWFRKFMVVRLSLQSVELALPFFAILAAFTNEDSARGTTALLIISSALALTVAGPLWRLLSRASYRVVMVVGCILAALSGMLLVGNHFLQLFDPTYLHAAALFVVTVATRGVFSARSLYFLDIAPDEHRVAELTVSKSLVRIAAITFSALLAAVAHMQHVVWAIVAIAVVNLLAAGLCYVLASATRSETQSA